MLQMMERLRESSSGNKDNGGPMGPTPSEISLMPMNLSTMLSKGVHAAAAHAGRGADLATLVPLHGSGEGSAADPQQRGGGMSESSMSPGGGDGDRGEMEDDEDHGHRGNGDRDRDEHHPPRDRHRSADIRAQFFADLKRLGGNLPPNMPPPPPTGPSQETPEATKASTSSPPPSISTTTTKGWFADSNRLSIKSGSRCIEA